MIWTEKDLCKFAMMRDAGYSIEEIRREFGETENKSRGGQVEPLRQQKRRGDHRSSEKE